MTNLTAIRHSIEHSSAAVGNEGEIKVLRDCYASLTPREQEVMKLVVSGMLNKLVGLKLGISEITVKAHRGKVMQKMKADSLADLVKIAVRLGHEPARTMARFARALTSIHSREFKYLRHQLAVLQRRPKVPDFVLPKLLIALGGS